MSKFIELTQHIENFGENYDRKILNILIFIMINTLCLENE